MEIQRRQFLKTGALAAGAASLPIISAAQLAGSDKIKVALIGCGGRGTDALKQVMQSPGIEVVALADAFKAGVDACFQKLAGFNKGEGTTVDVPEERRFVGLTAYKQAIDTADLVLLCSPPAWRPNHFSYAVERGKHVFMEKPVASTAAGVRQVLEAAKISKEKNLKCVVGFQRRFDPVYLETYKRVTDGMIGDVVGAQVHWMGGGVWVRPREEGESEMHFQCRNWYYFCWNSGDGICEQHIHNTDVANWFIGSYPERAYGTGSRSVRVGPNYGDIYDAFAVEFSYDKGIFVNSWWRHHPKTMNRVGEVISCAKGRAIAGQIWDRDGKQLWKYEGPRPNAQQVEQDELIKAIRTNGDLNMAEIGAHTTLTTILGRMAAYSGQNVPASRALNANDGGMIPEESFDATPTVLPGPDGLYPTPVPGVYDPFNPMGAV